MRRMKCEAAIIMVRVIRGLSHAVFAFVLALAMTGCRSASVKYPGTIVGPFHKPANYHLADGRMPAEMRRVALLPLTSALNTVEHQSGRKQLQGLLQSEIVKSGLFEVVYVTESKMELLTGQPAWRMIDQLPIDFVEKLTKEYDCQGVMFSHLAVYQPYPPLSIGWRMGLVHLNQESNNGNVVWEIDEMFNAGEKAVINSARQNAIKNGLSDPELDNNFGLMNSPRRFGRYTAEAVVATMTRLSPVATLSGAGGETGKLRAQGGFFSKLFRK